MELASYLWENKLNGTVWSESQIILSINLKKKLHGSTGVHN
jgi:hypothetical protein